MTPRLIARNAPTKQVMYMIREAARMGVWDGREISQYFVECNWYWLKHECQMILTRDVNHHLGGWWKNPDYERCWHLSISFPGGKKMLTLLGILKELFGENQKLLWVEGPFSKDGKAADVWHYRLFCDEHWEPIKPRGEVYTRTFTEAGWKSYSEYRASQKGAGL